MKVEFSSSFTRDLRRIRDRSIRERVDKVIDRERVDKVIDRERVDKVIEQIEKVDNFTKTSTIKKLRGHENRYRVRVGNYRLIFQFNEDTVTFLRCLPRQDIYRQVS